MPRHSRDLLGGNPVFRHSRGLFVGNPLVRRSRDLPLSSRDHFGQKSSRMVEELPLAQALSLYYD